MQEKTGSRNIFKKAGRGRAAALKAQTAASWIALIVSACVLTAAMIYSSRTLRSLDKKLTPLVNEAFAAVYADDGARTAELSERIKLIVHEAEMKLTIVAGHRDIAELKRCACELAALGELGDMESYVSCLNGIRSILSMLIENDRLTIRNVL